AGDGGGSRVREAGRLRSRSARQAGRGRCAQHPDRTGNRFRDTGHGAWSPAARRLAVPGGPDLGDPTGGCGHRPAGRSQGGGDPGNPAGAPRALRPAAGFRVAKPLYPSAGAAGTRGAGVVGLWRHAAIASPQVSRMTASWSRICAKGYGCPFGRFVNPGSRIQVTTPITGTPTVTTVSA